MDLSLLYFADDASGVDRDRYRLLIEGARFADRAGMAAVWTPERHFHPFGGLYPNPAVTGAAVAVATNRVSVRAGSVVAPLHDPIRVAEEWAVVDNLSHGRAAIAFASGWHAADFALCPEPARTYRERYQALEANVDTIRRLWRGEAVERIDGSGTATTVRIYPRPVQPELPFWITSSGKPDTFLLAGRLGANVLTHLLGQDLLTLRQNIDGYRGAYVAAGHPGHGSVTLMLHTFLGHSAADVAEQVREPLGAYIASSLNLSKAAGPDLRVRDEDAKFLIDRAVARFTRDSGLFGTADTARRMLRHVADAGVDEVACLVDFGLPHDRVLAALDLLAELVDP